MDSRPLVLGGCLITLKVKVCNVHVGSWRMRRSTTDVLSVVVTDQGTSDHV